jgi:ubiquinone/menaquinone biosynthesis C-methylase UbiE
VRRIYDKMAPTYDKRIAFWERVLFEEGRSWVCSEARGRVLEVGIGTGRNLSYYPPDVSVTGIDSSPAMLDIARRHATHLRREVDLQIADAQALPFSSGSFDTVVFTLCLCTIPDEAKAVSEAKRVLKPGGTVVLLEHVASSKPAIRLLQKAIDVVSVRVEGDHMVRDPLDHIRREGFEIKRLERSKWGIVERVVAARVDDETNVV